ncbi:MAG: hypothetical protein IPL61_33400 [Myxococcales bacterium]|nr:hypothetical protein [Myxococcales bacterium]
MARHALGMRIAVPLDAVRWFIASTPPSKKAPQDVTVLARPPAIAVGATIDLMGTTVRASASIKIETIEVAPEQLRVKIRLANIDLKVLGDAQTPVAALIKSGALDLSKPGNLLKFAPKKPDVLVEANDDIMVLDLMRNPKIRQNERVRRVLETLTPVVNVTGISTDGDFLVLQLRATPLGIPRAFNAARALAAG